MYLAWLREALDPRFVTPEHKIVDIPKMLERRRLFRSPRHHGHHGHHGENDENNGYFDQPSDEDLPFDPWGRPQDAMLKYDDPFVDKNEDDDKFEKLRSTEFRDSRRLSFGDEPRREMSRVDKSIPPEHTSGKYNITKLMDEKLMKDPFAEDRRLDAWREEVEMQFGERPPKPPPALGRAPKPAQAVYDFTSLEILFKGKQVRPLYIPQPDIPSPLAPRIGTEAELQADYDNINALPLEARASWWIAFVLWSMGEDDESLGRVRQLINAGQCPAEAFPYDLKKRGLPDFKFEMGPLLRHGPLRITDDFSDPVENTFWVPKLKGINGSAVRFMRPPSAKDGDLDLKYFPVPVLQSTILPGRYDIGRPELKLWDGIPGHTFRLPPYCWPDELSTEDVDGTRPPFAVDIRRIAVQTPMGTYQPIRVTKFRPTRRLRTVYREDRTKKPFKNREYNPDCKSPIRRGREHGVPPPLVGDDQAEDVAIKSFIVDEYEYDLEGDKWGPVGGFEGRDYASERQKDHDRWFRYFLVNNDPWGRTIVVNGVSVPPHEIAGPLPEFAIFELGEQAAFWFGVGGRHYDPRTAEREQPPEASKRKAAESPEIVRGGRAPLKYQRKTETETRGSRSGRPTAAPRTPTKEGVIDLTSPATSTAKIFDSLQLSDKQHRRVTRSTGEKPVHFRRKGASRAADSGDEDDHIGLRGGSSQEFDIDLEGDSSDDEATTKQPESLERFSTPELQEVLMDFDCSVDLNLDRSQLIQRILEEEAAEDERELEKELEKALNEVYGAANAESREEAQARAQAIIDEYYTSEGSDDSDKSSSDMRHNVDAEMGETVRRNERADSVPVATELLHRSLPAKMSIAALEQVLEEFGICVDPAWDRAKLIEEFAKLRSLVPNAED